jgi:hypothetical protein
VPSKSVAGDITALVGTWTAWVGVPDPLPWTLVVSADGTFQADDLMKLSTAAATVPVHFAGQVQNAGRNQYRFVFSSQGGQVLPAPDEVLTMTLSPDGSRLSYTVAGTQVTYHRGG